MREWVGSPYKSQVGSGSFRCIRKYPQEHRSFPSRTWQSRKRRHHYDQLERVGIDPSNTYGEKNANCRKNNICRRERLKAGLRQAGNRIRNYVVLTRLAPALRAALVEMAWSRLTTGASHLNNLGSPFLNLSNARDCSWNTARIESGDPHLSMMAATGPLRRSWPVRSVYLSKAPPKRASKLGEVVVVFAVEDMSIREMTVARCGRKVEGGR